MFIFVLKHIILLHSLLILVFIIYHYFIKSENILQIKINLKLILLIITLTKCHKTNINKNMLPKYLLIEGFIKHEMENLIPCDITNLIKNYTPNSTSRKGLSIILKKLKNEYEIFFEIKTKKMPLIQITITQNLISLINTTKEFYDIVKKK